MEKPQGTSFIPKSPVRATAKPRSRRRVFIFTYITFVFFFGTLIATVGIFVWNLTIDKQLESQKNNLAVKRESFDNAQLESVRELEKRMNIASGILDTQVAVSSIFDTLEQSTLRSVQVTGLEYTKETDNSLNLSLTMSTRDFNSALFQKEIFSGDSILMGASVSKIMYTNPVPSEGASLLSQEGVTYVVTKTLSPADIPYVPGSSVQSYTTNVPVADEVSSELSTETADEAPVSEITDTTN